MYIYTALNIAAKKGKAEIALGNCCSWCLRGSGGGGQCCGDTALGSKANPALWPGERCTFAVVSSLLGL